MNPIHDHNRAAWDARVQDGKRFTRAAMDDEMDRPLEILDPLGWLGGEILMRIFLGLFLLILQFHQELQVKRG